MKDKNLVAAAVAESLLTFVPALFLFHQVFRLDGASFGRLTAVAVGLTVLVAAAEWVAVRAQWRPAWTFLSGGGDAVSAFTAARAMPWLAAARVVLLHGPTAGVFVLLAARGVGFVFPAAVFLVALAARAALAHLTAERLSDALEARILPHLAAMAVPKVSGVSRRFQLLTLALISVLFPLVVVVTGALVRQRGMTVFGTTALITNVGAAGVFGGLLPLAVFTGAVVLGLWHLMAARLEDEALKAGAVRHERDRLRDALGRYLDPALVSEVMREGAHLPAESFNASVLFADLRDFTELTELLKPREVVELLNQYYALVENAVAPDNGWINKFGGDSLLAVFGAPGRVEDHAARAVRSAQRLRQAMDAFNERQKAVGGPAIRFGVGVHCGDLLAGNVGGGKRLEYTVIGDVVNVAARIQALNKKFGSNILVSAAVRDAARLGADAKPMPLTTLSGKSDPIQVYAL